MEARICQSFEVAFHTDPAAQDSFQQHDVQELCRVLFDALESTFQETVNERLVNDLYQGEQSGFLAIMPSLD